MATKSAILAVKIISDAKDFKKGTDDAASSIDKLKDKMSKLTVPALVVGAGLLKVGGDFGKMASDFEQNSGAVDAVFKNMSGQIDDFAAKSAKGMGLSANSYKEAAAKIGSQLKNAGVPMDQLVGKTDGMIKMGADFAAQFGGTVPDAVDAMSSALKGEMDPIEKYGITLNDAMIKAEMGATGASKAQAIMNLIQKQGADAAGANAREADTAAGAQARLTASYDDMGVQLGTVLLPIMSKAAEILSGIVDWVTKNQEMVTILAVGLGILAGAILILNGVMLIMNAIALINPFVLLGVAVAALIGFIIYLATQTTFFQTVWAAVSQFCTDVWNGFVGFATDVWNGFVGFLTDTMTNIGNFIGDVVGNIGNFFSTIFGNVGRFVGDVLRNIGGFFSNVFNGARSIVQGVINGIIGAFNSVMSVVNSVLSFVGTIFNNVFNGARNIVTGVINAIVGAFNNVSNAVQGVISWVRSLFNGFSVPGWMRDVMRFLGMGGTGFDMTLGYDLTGLPADMGATGGASMAGFFTGTGGSSRTEITNINVTVNGAIDPIGTAKQIKNILNADAMRNGSISAGGSIW